MKIQIVYDNESIAPELNTGWGLSLLVDDHVLFDTGDDGPKLLENLAVLGISPAGIDKIVISHDHWDHWGGLWNLLEHCRHAEVHYLPGFSADFKMRFAGYAVNECARNEAYELSSSVYVTKGIRFTYKGKPMVERALVCNGQKTVLVSGCAHPDILAVKNEAEKELPGINISGVIGGLHLESKSEADVRKIYGRYGTAFPAQFIPLHCSGRYIRELSGCSLAAGSIVQI